MARRPNRLLLRLLYASLGILALMHPAAVGRLANLTVTVALTAIQGAADAAAANPGPAVLAGLLLYVAYQIRTHRPRARAYAPH